MFYIAGSDDTDYDGEYTVALDALVTSSTASAKKVVMISFCECEDGDDDTCGVQAIEDPDNIVETIVINVGSDVSNNDQFACLVNGGIGSLIYNEYPNFGEAINDTEHVKDEVCQLPTPSPTPMPSDVPTDGPTQLQSDKPTKSPSQFPSNDPTDDPSIVC